MKTKEIIRSNVTQGCSAIAAASIWIIAAISSRPAMADIPDRPKTVLQGMYKVETCNDPLFPMGKGREWFLDFGKGMSNGQTSGKVAVSLRQNPNVRVNIMVWQYFRRENVLIIGNQSAEGSGKAVARGVWTLGSDLDAVFLIAQTCNITMKTAVPNDY